MSAWNAVYGLFNRFHFTRFFYRDCFADAVLQVTPARLGKSCLTGQIVGWSNLNCLSAKGSCASALLNLGGNAANLDLNCAFSVLYDCAQSWAEQIFLGANWGDIHYLLPIWPQGDTVDTHCWDCLNNSGLLRLRFQTFICKVELSWFWFEFKSLHYEFILNRGLRSEKHFQSCFITLQFYRLWIFCP